MTQIEFIDTSNLLRVLNIGIELSFITPDNKYRKNPIIKYKDRKIIQVLLREWKLRLQDIIIVDDNATYNLFINCQYPVIWYGYI